MGVCGTAKDACACWCGASRILAHCIEGLIVCRSVCWGVGQHAARSSAPRARGALGTGLGACGGRRCSRTVCRVPMAVLSPQRCVLCCRLRASLVPRLSAGCRSRQVCSSRGARIRQTEKMAGGAVCVRAAACVPRAACDRVAPCTGLPGERSQAGLGTQRRRRPRRACSGDALVLGALLRHAG